MKNIISVIAVKKQRTHRKRYNKISEMKRPTIPEHQQVILNTAVKNGLESVRINSLESWFKLIHYFAEKGEPAINILLWYKAGKEESMQKLIDGGLGKSDTVKYEKIRIEEVRQLMGKLR